MRIRTGDLIGVALDWAATRAKHPDGPAGEGWYERDENGLLFVPLFDPLNEYTMSPSTRWGQGGPIIEQARISMQVKHDGVWLAYIMQDYVDEPRFMSAGPTPLIAAMRCYVTSCLGDFVDVPDEFVD